MLFRLERPRAAARAQEPARRVLSHHRNGLWRRPQSRLEASLQDHRDGSGGLHRACLMPSKGSAEDRGDTYGDVTVKTMAAAMEKFPRMEIGAARV
jgi:hypothetical protein